MAVSNNERFGRALDALKDALHDAAQPVWEAQYGKEWINKVHELSPKAIGKANPKDVAWILQGMIATWHNIWSKRLGSAERGYVGELLGARNAWAHQTPLSSDDLVRHLDTAERLLTSLNAPEASSEIRKMRLDLQRQVYDEAARTAGRRVAALPTEGEPTAGLPAWRDVIAPHQDVASGQFQQAEFAANLYFVSEGQAESEYQDPVAFFRRTYLTAGLSKLLVKAAQRLSGTGGDPVVDLQTNFGGGKTHSMIALYHLASGVPTTSLAGVSELLKENGVALPASVKRAVIVGQFLTANSPKKFKDGTEVNTIWGNIAYQLAGKKGYNHIAEADRSGSNPGNKFVDVLRMAGPSVILIDEWVAYARQLTTSANEMRLLGGDFDNQFTFAQTLTEAVQQVKNCLLLISIPASDIEIGGEKGREATARLVNVVRRVSALWQPAGEDESFEIVRRRLFEPMTESQIKKRDTVVKAFVDYYRSRAAEFPTGSSEADYRRRMELAYPIHPEFFDRLYKDWSTLDNFQRTRGVLRLMASVISVLWQRNDKSLLIMPGMLPLDDSRVLAELGRYLEDGWDAVVHADVDGPTSLPLRLDQEHKNLGRYSAARRSARAVYLASAPRSDNNRGVDLKNILLAVVQPGESTGTFSDSLTRMSSEATYLYVNASQYWYNLRANVTRLANDRANSNFSIHDADAEVKRRLQAERGKGLFSALHVFPDGPGDVIDDDDGVHLIVLSVEHPHVANVTDSKAIKIAEQILTQRNAGPRMNQNLLVFVAANEARLNDVRSAARQYLAWKSILEDKETLQLIPNDTNLAMTKIGETQRTLQQRVDDAYQMVMVPSKKPGDATIEWHITRPSGAGSLADRVGNKLEAEEKLISRYSGTRVRMDLDRIPLWSANRDVKIADLWDAYCRFPYLPRLASFEVLQHAVRDGIAKTDWITDGFAYAEAREGDDFRGLIAAAIPNTARSGLLVHPEIAEPLLKPAPVPVPEPAGGSGSPGPQPPPQPPPSGQPKVRFYATFTLDGVRGVAQLSDILNDVVDHLKREPGSGVEITLEVRAQNEAGFSAQTIRVVNENSRARGSLNPEFES
jgi:hypothetical protein